MWKQIQKRFKKIPGFITNLYFIAAVLFGIWMVFVDDNNLVAQYRRHKELSALREKKAFYEAQIAQTDKAYQELTTNPATQEKFAREHYWMKKDNEDVFVIVKNDKPAE